MFLTKKLISAFLLPIPISIMLFVLGIFFLLINSKAKAKFFIISAFTWIMLVSNQTVSNALLKPLENSYQALTETPNVEYILVLGNGHTTNEELSITSQVNPTAINRLAEGIKHYKIIKAQNKNIKLIVSGYSGYDENTHAFMQEKLAITLGVEATDIIRLDEPKDTPQEALKTKEIVGNKEFILVTSASHMKRSMMLFNKLELNAIPAPTNYLSHEERGFSSYFNAKNIEKCEVAIHEYLGIAWGVMRKII